MPAHDVRALMEGGTTALMVLDGVAYTLRITRAGKLILTK
ncbi:MAG: hemin uptake protein HemP [Pseudomonadota bacterium]